MVLAKERIFKIKSHNCFVTLNVVKRLNLNILRFFFSLRLAPAEGPVAGETETRYQQVLRLAPGHAPSVLVVDDVVTTGATLMAVRQCLLEQGAEYVSLAAVASTPTSTGGRVRRPIGASQPDGVGRAPVVVRAA